MSSAPAEPAAVLAPNDPPQEMDFEEFASEATETPIAEDVSKLTTESKREDSANSTTLENSIPNSLPKGLPVTPRIKKKVPWRGKNIMILIPRDDERGLPGKSPLPLRPDAIERMFSSWRELGYNIDGFDLLVEGYQAPGTDDSQSRLPWPSMDDVNKERVGKKYEVTLPDLNAWKNYVNELQEAKLRALGVSFADEEPAPSISPATTDLSRHPSAQYPPLPFSPPIPTSSASSSHGLTGFTVPSPFIPGVAVQSPGISTGSSPVPFGNISGKFGARQSISLPTGNSPFQFGQLNQAWANQAATLQGLARIDSPSSHNFNGIISPQSPYGIDNLQQSTSPAMNLHQRRQSMQILSSQHPGATSPLLEKVQEEEREDDVNKSPSKTPEPHKHTQDSLHSEIQDAEYHLEEQLRNELEHEDYNPRNRPGPAPSVETLASAHERRASGNLAVSEHFANDPSKPIVLHHPRPHSRGQSLSQNFFLNPHMETSEAAGHSYERLDKISETAKGDGDKTSDIETNPSNLGTPVQDFDFAAVLAPPNRTVSTGSNPFNESASVTSNRIRRGSHGTKLSSSKLNVKAPEFKFNPTSNFTPGQFSFTGAGFLPAVFHAGVDNAVAYTSPSPVPQSGSFSSFKVDAPSFEPANSEFSFSTSGPKFRPDAPSFTPFQSLASPMVQPGSKTLGHPRRTESIFGNITINTSDIIRPSKKSKAIPIVRPSSRASNAVPLAEEDETYDNADGRLTTDSRVKRAKSAAPEDEDVPQFAGVTEDFLHGDAKKSDGSVDDDNTLHVDTSLSSVQTYDMIDTKQSTAASSDISIVNKANPWRSFEGSFDKPPLSRQTSKEQTHKKSLSATAPVFLPGASLYGSVSGTSQDQHGEDSFSKRKLVSGIDASTTEKLSDEPAKSPRISPKPKRPQGLAASRFATMSPHSGSSLAELPNINLQEDNKTLEEPDSSFDQNSSAAGSRANSQLDADLTREPTFEEIDAVMQHIENDPRMGVMKSVESANWHQEAAGSTPVDSIRSNNLTKPLTPEPSATPHRRVPSLSMPQVTHAADIEDPFLDPPGPSQSPDMAGELDEPNLGSEAITDWDATFSEDEHSKLENRTQFFDGRVNEIVGSLLSSRLQPLEKTLLSIQNGLASGNRRALSSRREIRSLSGERRESDADDEDEDPVIPRSSSPRRDRRMEQIRLAVLEAMSMQKTSPLLSGTGEVSSSAEPAILEMLNEVKANLKAIMDSNAADSSTVESDKQVLVGSQPHSTLKPDEELVQKMDELQNKVSDLDQRLYFEQTKVEREIAERRAAEDASAELNRKLQAAETRVEVEIINRSVFDQRVADLDDRMRQQEEKTEEEVKLRRAAEDRLSEVQRLLKISSEEETHLREALEQRDNKIKDLEQNSGKKAMRMTLLEAAQNNATQSQTELTNKINTLEADLREIRQDNDHWRAEAERADDNARRNAGELSRSLTEVKSLHKSLTTVTAQLEENERLRESWRSKFLALQDDMGKAARDIAEDNARRIKKEQIMLARQEVLDARLQAEAKTRERLEVEMERLQVNERTGMRAVNECNRLEGLLSDLRTENHALQQEASRHQREFEEARESGVNEVRRTRLTLQADLDFANNQVNVVRQELEDQINKLRAESDNLKLEHDTAREKHDMLLEDIRAKSAAEVVALHQKYQNEVEDMQTRHERQLSTAIEDGQRSEQALLERLSLSSAKIEHLQDRTLHLEDKLEIAKQAAAAAAMAAKSAGTDFTSVAVSPSVSKSPTQVELPEKISPQALRESIMVLQEQLQAREQRIEELEHIVANTDPDAATKISKRDDEIIWLRELLAVRHGDLQDIISALSSETFDRERIKDAAIRLKANLQMEEQERERAMNGGSAISLPNIAQSLQAATPRVAQAVGSSLNAWERWRKSSQPSFLSGVLSSPAGSLHATPSKNDISPGGQPKALSGLLTPPASGFRQTPKGDNLRQPTAFASTGHRHPPRTNTRSRAHDELGVSSLSDSLKTKQETPPRHEEQAKAPVTPPMMRQSGYDSDAQPNDFDDNDFFED